MLYVEMQLFVITYYNEELALTNSDKTRWIKKLELITFCT